jgi:AraC-like DNA-binding protein
VESVCFQFSTAAVARAGRFARWREMINERFVALDVAPLGGRAAPWLGGSVSMRAMGELRVVHVRASAMSATRTRRHVDGSPEDDYLLALHLSGSAHAAQDRRRVSLRPGDLALFDSARPYVIEFRGAGAFEHLIYRIPRAALDARCPGLARATAIGVGLASAEGRLAVPYLHALARTSASIRPASAERLSGTALDLLATALGATAGLEPEPGAADRGRATQLRRHALARLGDPELSPVDVARAGFVSVRQLHRLFAQQGTTFGSFVREERLRRCRGDLADPRLDRSSIAEIAHRSGYRSAAHFTRAFRARYGMAPRDYRRSARALDPGG